MPAGDGITFGPGGGPFGPGGAPFGPEAPSPATILEFPLFAVLDFPLASERSYSVADIDDNAGFAVLDFPLARDRSFSVAVIAR